MTASGGAVLKISAAHQARPGNGEARAPWPAHQ